MPGNVGDECVGEAIRAVLSCGASHHNSVCILQNKANMQWAWITHLYLHHHRHSKPEKHPSHLLHILQMYPICMTIRFQADHLRYNTSDCCIPRNPVHQSLSNWADCQRKNLIADMSIRYNGGGGGLEGCG